MYQVFVIKFLLAGVFIVLHGKKLPSFLLIKPKYIKLHIKNTGFVLKPVLNKDYLNYLFTHIRQIYLHIYYLM